MQPKTGWTPEVSGNSQMQAAWFEATGEADTVLQVGEMAIPVPAAGEILVRIHASGVNPSDVKKRLGKMPAPTDFPRIIPHSDGAGVVVAVGAGVPEGRIGKRVWLWNAQWHRAFGTAAQFCALPSGQAVDLPDHIGFAQGACLGIPAQTAWVAVMDGRPAPGRSVLVHGGAGSVGALAIRVAHLADARVFATVSGEAKARIARDAGANETINYRTTDVPEAILDLTDGKGADHIVDVDFGANHVVNAACIAVNGSIAAYSAPSAPVFPMDYYAFAMRATRMRFVQVYLLEAAERQAAIAGITDLLQQNALSSIVARNYALDQIAEAHKAQETGGVTGNIVLDLNGETHGNA